MNGNGVERGYGTECDIRGMGKREMLEAGQMLFAEVARVGMNAPVALMPEKSFYPAHLRLPVQTQHEIFIPSFQLI